MNNILCMKQGCMYKRRENMKYCCILCSNDKGHGPLCASNILRTPYTIKGKFDGFGEQYLAVMSGIAYCIKKKYMYVHSPFTKMQHGCNVAKTNEFIGIRNQSLPKFDTSIMIQRSFAKEVHFCKNPSIYYDSNALRSIRNHYYSTEKPNVGDIDIAIHIRRGDITRTNARHTDNAFYKNLIQQLKRKYPSYTILVFSQGKYKDFEDLGLEENCFRLNLNVFKTFHSLVCAKVFIQAKSSFSYCAGILNKNTVYHMKGYLHKLHHWFDVASLRGT